VTEAYLRRERSPLRPVRLTEGQRPPSLEAAYAAQAALQRAEPERWGGWKLGGTNAGSRAAFGVGRPYYGALDRAEILENPTHAPGFPLAELKGEAEIALRLAPGLDGADAWCVALEMPSSPLEGLPEIGVAALVADRCAAGALVLGPVREGPPPSDGRIAQEIDGQRLSEGRIADLSASPAELLADFLTLARSHGQPLAAGQWVATGGVTACLPYAPGSRVRVLLDGEPALDLLIAAEAD
jgi:2-keto-4-pentenoate hydratase